ncbi:MAG TPA: chorismate mutase [Candidatus Omnitrophota bacterium]|nr:chorismate mutase [Candidatus Omnitrophota bacterium]
MSDGERDEIRRAIDRLDRDLLRLLEDRAELARRIGALKQASGEATLDAARERDLLERIEREAKGAFPRSGVRAIFREIVSASRAAQGAFRVAYLGAEGGFAHQAAVRRFGASSTYAATASPQHLLEAIGSERAEHGIFALEGDAEDPPFDAYDLLLGAEAAITAEFVDRGGYEALGRARAPKRLIAHPAALALCQRWRAALGPGVEVVAAAGSLEAGRRAAADPDAVCLAPAIVADLAGLPEVEPEAEDAPRRTRRFLVLGRASGAASGRDKTALLLALENTPGALLEALRALAAHGVNLLWIESRTHRWRPGEHLFLLEVAGHQDADPLRPALAEMRARTRLFRVLGSFPAAESGW